MSDPGFGQGVAGGSGDRGSRLDDETVQRLARAIGENVGQAVQQVLGDVNRLGGPLSREVAMQQTLSDILDTLEEIRDALNRQSQQAGGA